ncbi:MAG: LPS assembly protein LptD, partial [Nitrospinota bacterium]
IISIDGVDGVEDENRLSYSLTNRFLGKVRGREGLMVRELLRVSLSQSYDIAEARRKQRREEKQRPFSPLSLDVVSNPANWAHLSYRSSYDVYSDEVTNWSLNAELNGGKRWYLKVQREWQRGGDRFVTLSGGLSPVRSWFFEAGFRRNTLVDLTLERSLAVHWQGQCCGLGVRLVDRRDETEVFLTFNLVGVLEGERAPGYTMRYLPLTEEEGISQRLRGVIGGLLGRERE